MGHRGGWREEGVRKNSKELYFYQMLMEVHDRIGMQENFDLHARRRSHETIVAG